MSKLNSFCKQFVASIKGDDAEVQAQKAWRSAESALKIQITALEGDVIKKEDEVSEAKEKLESARINGGNKITDRDYYISSLIDAKNTLTIREKALKDHQSKIEFLKAEYSTLNAE